MKYYLYGNDIYCCEITLNNEEYTEISEDEYNTLLYNLKSNRQEGNTVLETNIAF